jgi:hypothetical protein
VNTIINRRPSASGVLAAVAIFVALGTGAAFGLPGKSTVDRNDIRKNAVKSKQVKDGSLGSIDLLDNGVTGDDVEEGTLGKVRNAEHADSAEDAVNAQSAQNAQNAVNAQNAQNAQNAVFAQIADNSDTLGGQPAIDFYRFDTSIPSGYMVRGVWGGREDEAGNVLDQEISFPVEAETALTDATVNVAAGGFSGTAGSDDDAGCTGTVTNPNAPAGKVCIYIDSSGFLGSNGTVQGRAASAPTLGFEVRGPNNAGGDQEAHGSWAYRAP